MQAGCAEMKYVDEHFRSGTVFLDGKDFQNCTFGDGVMLTFSGTAAVNLSNCKFGNVKWSFDRGAGQMLKFLQAVSAPGSGMEGLLSKLFPQLRFNFDSDRSA
jgi:hypothetical protein